MFNTKFKFFLFSLLFVSSFFVLGKEVDAEDSRVLVWFNGFTSNGENCNLTDMDSCGSFVDSNTAVTLGSKPIGNPLTDSSTGFSSYVLWMAGNTTPNSNTSILSGNISNIPTGITGYSVNLVCDLPGGGSSPFTVNVAGSTYTSSAVPSGSVCNMTIEVNDDPGFTSPCGDGVCSLTDGESCLTCVSDCLSCGAGNIQISVVPQENRVSEGGNLTEVYRVTVTPTNWTGPINLSAECDYPGMSCHFFDTSGSLQIECIAGIGGGCFNTVWDKESHVGTNSGSMVYDLHVRNYNGATNLPASSIPYLINLNAQGAGYYDGSGDAVWCNGNCSAAAAAKLWVDPPCNTYIVGGPTRMVCDQITATSYRIRWTAGTWNGLAGQGIPTESRVRASLVKNDVNTGCGVGSNCVLNLSGQSFDLSSANVSGLQPGQTYFNRVAQLCTDSGGGNVMYKDEPDTIGWGGNPADWTCTTLSCNPVTYSSGNSGVSTSPSGPASSNISVSPNSTYYAFCDFGVNVSTISAPSGCTWVGAEYPSNVSGTQYRFTCTAPSSPQTVNISCQMGATGNPQYYCASGPNSGGTVTVAGACTPGQTRTVGAGVCTGIETCDAGGNWPGTYNYTSTNGSSCNDSVACNGPDVCSNGVCSGGAIITGNVTLTPSTINTGSTSTASVSGGWTNVNYLSSNTAVATVSGSILTGVAGGSSSISGTGTVPGGYDNNCSINPATLTVNPPVCPSSGNTVSLSSNNTTVGSSVTASAPVGWSGGSFVSNDNSKATVSGNTVTGQGVGSASISGNNNWTAPNGAVNCGLNPATITVGAAPYFDLNILEATQTVTQGGSASYTVELTSQNSFSGTVTLSSSGCPTNATCTFAGGNSAVLSAGGVATKYLDVVTQVTTPANTYTLGASGVSGVLTDSDTAQLVVDALPTPPTVDLKCNGQDNPTIDYGSNCDLTWTTTNGATSCTASGNWSGAKAFAASNGPETQSGLTANRAYTITCSNGGGAGAPDTVNVTVRPQGPGGGGGGGGGSCGQINLTWNNVSGEAGYNVYRNTVNSSSTAALLSPANAADDTTFTDSPGTGTFYYWITYFTNPGAFESSKAAILNNPLGGTSCDGSISTDKDIATINGNTPSSYTPSVGNGNQTPANVTYNKNDIIGFSVNILHNGALGSEDATGVFITDKLINLIEPASDWQLQRNGTNILEDTSVDCTDDTTARSTITADRYGVCGAAPNQTIYIKIPDLNQGDITQVTFRAQLAVASGFTQSSSRFQNSATISYTKNGLGETDERTSKTPLLLFNVTSIPSKTEVAP